MAQTRPVSPQTALNTFEILYNKCIYSKILTFVVEREEEEYSKGGGVKKLLKEIERGGIRNLYIEVDAREEEGVKELMKVDSIPREVNIYLTIYYSHNSKGVERVFEWAKQREERVILIQLRQNYKNYKYMTLIEKIEAYSKNILKEQIEGHSNIISSFCKVKADTYVSYVSNMFDVDELDDDMERKRELEESVLRNVIQLYETNEVIELKLDVPSLSAEVEEWKTLEQLIRHKNCTLNGTIYLKNGKVEDITWLDNFFQLFKNQSTLILAEEHPLNFKTNSVQHLNFQIGYFYGIIDFKRETVGLWCSSVEDVNQQLQRIPNETANEISIFSIEDIKKYELKPLLKLIKQALETRLLNVYDVSIRIKDERKKYDLSSTKEGREILAIIEKREAKRMNFLIKNNRKGKYNRAKMMVVGAGGAGKTSLCNSLLEKPFNPNHDSTVVANAELNAAIDNKDVDISNWKEIGKGEYLLANDFRAMTKNINKDKKEGKQKVDEENEKIYDNKESLTKFIRKEKLEGSISVIQEEKQKKARFWGLFRRNKMRNDDELRHQPLLKRDENGKKLSIWDFGGQKVFDVLHHLYLTNAGLVLLVVNLLLFLTDPELAVEELETWFKSLCVYTKSVRVFIVGTRAKSRKLKKKSLEKINATIKNVIEDQDAVQVVKNRSGEKILNFFPVENSLGKRNEKYLRPLKAAIAEALEPVDGPNELKLPANEMIPLAWMLFIQIMHRDMGNVVALNELFEKGQDMGFELEEMKHLVDFFTRSGIIVSFHKRFEDIERSENEILDDVVLKPNWLLSALGSFICDESLHQTEFSKVAEKENMGKLVKIYRDNGILANSLLEEVLKLKNVKPREIAFIKNVCQKMLVMSKLSDFPSSIRLPPRNIEASKGFWMVPSMNKLQSLNLPAFSGDVTEGKIDWLDIVPQGLFERCVCSLLSQDPDQMKLEAIARNAARLFYKNVGVQINFLSYNEYGITVATKDVLLLREVRAMLVNVTTEVNALGFALTLISEVKFSGLQQDLLIPVPAPVQTNAASATAEEQVFEWDCFLSHTWTEVNGESCGTHRRVMEIGELLRSEGLKVWIDDVEMKEAVDHCMSEGIDKSAVFIAFITKSYIEKAKFRDNNSRKEFGYASIQGVDFMIPVLLNGELWSQKDWKGPVGFHFGPALYYDFSTPERVKENLGRLCEAILEAKNKRLKLIEAQRNRA